MNEVNVQFTDGRSITFQPDSDREDYRATVGPDGSLTVTRTEDSHDGRTEDTVISRYPRTEWSTYGEDSR